MASLNPNLKDFWFDGEPCPQNYRKVRHRVLYGGRASSKSWEFAGMAASIASQCKARFLCVRRFQNKIKDSVYTLIAKQIDNFSLDGFNVLAAEIKHSNGSDFAFYGIERNIDEIKSFEGADILWIEEAHNLTQEQWLILEPTIRKEGSEIWISFNPRLMSDFIYRRFILNTPKNSIVRLINHDENPFLSSTMAESIAEMAEEDHDLYLHVYKGVPKADDEKSIIKRSWVEACIDAHEHLNIDMRGARTVGYDVADDGDDKNAIAVFDGSICVDLAEWSAPEDELVESALRAWGSVEGGSLVYDSIGVGAHTGSTLKNNGVKSGYYKFNAAGAVQNKNHEYSNGVKNGEKFENLKAQAWQDVADRMRNTFNAINKGEKFDPSELISISSDVPMLDTLKDELCIPRRAYSKRGLDMAEPKDKIKDRGFSSPNKADSFIMGACPHLVKNGFDEPVAMTFAM
jgi:phage terminase large subunit